MEPDPANKFLYRTAAHLVERFGEGLADTAIVFNNKRPALFMRSYLAEIYGNPVWSPEFLTIQQFFSEVAGLTAASQLKQFFTLFQLYNEQLHLEGQEGMSADIFYPLAEVILGDFSQIDYYLADAGQLFTLIGQYAEIQQQFPNFDEEQIAFLESFWQSFSSGTQNQVQQKFIELWRRMPGLYQSFHRALKEQQLLTQAGIYRYAAEEGLPIPEKYPHVVFVGFNALSRAEEKLFKSWQDQGKASFYFDADAHYLDDPLQEAGFFIRRNINAVGLVNQLPGSHNRINNPQKEIVVIRANGHAAQGKLLNEILPKKDGPAPDHRAIILADETLLMPVLQTIPGDDLNITMGYPFKQSAVYGLCDFWLTVQEELDRTNATTVPYRLVLSWLYNPVVGPPQPGRDQLYRNITERRITDVPVESLWHLGAAAASLFTPAEKGPGALSQLKSLLAIAAEAAGLRGIEKRLLFEALRSLNVLQDNLDQATPGRQEMSARFLFRLIRRALEGLSVPFEGEPLSGLQVMGLLESRCLDFDELIVLGMNEGVLPKVSTSPTFIPDNLRRAFGLPVLENQNAIFAYFFYRLLHCAKKVTVVFNGITDEQSTGEASRFIRQLQFETSCLFVERDQQHRPFPGIGDKAIVIAKKGPVWNRLQRFFSSGGGPMEDKISASAFTDYVSCSLKFFFSRLGGLKEPADLPDQIEANMIGTVLHRLMETVYAGAKDAVVTSDYLMLKEKQLPRLCLEALSAELYRTAGTPVLKPNALQQIVLKVLEQYAINILRHDETLVPFTIRELENKSDYRVQRNVQVGDYTQKVWLYGIIDRVDECNRKTRIVDYKTGKDKIKFSDFDSLFDENGKTQNKALLQTLFYTSIYEKVRRLNGVEPHLYTVRSFKEDTVFRGNSKLVLQDEALEQYKGEFEVKMNEKLNELFNADIPFRQTTNLETCKYCPYNGICQR